MSVEAVKKFFKKNNIDIDIKILKDTSTVEKAANAIGVSPGEIAKSMLFKLKDKYIMVILSGEKKIDNRKFKDTFHCKARMVPPEEVLEITGHPVGGVCPYGLKTDIDIYYDISLKNYKIVYPAAGDINAAVAVKVDDMDKIVKGEWVDVSQ
ncbi:prolyl-tRNA editing protein [Thermoanaerobacterium thermosaccharolyticum]|jgi:prolyl-tRNA editing enzyme YbaK/EbsC (Cys-tRNA(Pro) deacylase)|uniref:Prolyl-tRNA editing protein n=1 Tax=Thermoanaerobacterium thermosaccharolyticum TaxID=1517 RepID=A0A231VG48_THETR|nr:YbaK/EbsC family protein [Thermoanaerobacterium thermosaccharolyticum]AST56702.1 prolyl-tRNA synthetase [Thermoanaerobacterium thermosaccharolyticum]KAA5808076.1 YbaK/EbsC family protein [Thermoanaerobacterium thermosaccharolyticum]OXT07001.1 prolyl-tRNA editing protein [Thermoanaerobacterium thermosaccharolyticum]PHO07381.1 prolyl-tRNA editing protein [Thermoanaerobacterium thermosaccharolyticum]